MRKRDSMRRLALAAAVPAGLVLAAGCPNIERLDESGTGAPGTVDGASVPSVSAAQTFAQNCQGCHGEHGEGRVGPPLNRLASRPDADLSAILRAGKGRMPSFASQLSDAQIESLVAYVKKLGATK